MVTAESIPAAGIVAVMATVTGQQIVRLIVDASVTVSRPMHVAFARVVIHHIEPHFDAVIMEGFNHRAELFGCSFAAVAGGVCLRRLNLMLTRQCVRAAVNAGLFAGLSEISCRLLPNLWFIAGLCTKRKADLARP